MYEMEASAKFFLSFKNKGFDYFFGNTAAGRILVFWKSTLFVTILDDFDQGVLCHVNNGVNFLFAGFIYGRNEPILRKVLWDKLRTWSRWCDEDSFMIMGDFNEVLHCGDRSSSMSTSHSSEDFHNCISNVNMQEINAIGPHFTWTNKSSQGRMIPSKLDRCLANLAWLENFKNSFTIVDLPGVSDHCSLILHLDRAGISGPKPFKFYNAWTSHHLFL